MALVIREERFWQRRGTAADWATVNPTLGPAEFGYETDTGRLKIGDESTPWNSLNYLPMPNDAAEVPYDNVSSGLTATNVQTAIDELAGGGGGGSSSAVYGVRENFLRGVRTSTNTGTSFVTGEYQPVAYNNGTGATCVLDAPGVIMKTGSAVNGLVNLFATQGLRLKPGNGEATRIGCRLMLPVLSDATHTFIFTFGFRTVITGTENDLAVASYSHGTNSGNWTLQTREGGAITTTNASIGPAAATYTDIEVEIDATGSTVILYVDGVPEANHSTNIPTIPMGVASLLFKTVGATERTAQIARVWVK